MSLQNLDKMYKVNNQGVGRNLGGGGGGKEEAIHIVCYTVRYMYMYVSWKRPPFQYFNSENPFQCISFLHKITKSSHSRALQFKIPSKFYIFTISFVSKSSSRDDPLSNKANCSRVSNISSRAPHFHIHVC